MSDKIAIRDAYGQALKALGGRNRKVVALEATWAVPLSQSSLERSIRTVISTWESVSSTWSIWQPGWRWRGSFPM